MGMIVMKNLSLTLLIAVLLLGAEAKGEMHRSDAFLEGRGASVEFHGEGEVDTFRPGVKLFTDRIYTVKECPKWLLDRKFLRNGIDCEKLLITNDGVLTLLTPEPDDPHSSSQCKAVEALGFEWIANPKNFQLFGEKPIDRVRVYQKRVKKGDRIALNKWVVVVGFASARSVADKPWSENQGEQLYNGIVLPKEWPPQTIEQNSTKPIPVPYLKSRPSVVPIDIGRQLFVDSFLVEKTNLKRVFHVPKKYAGNPIFKPETDLELHSSGTSAAVPKDGGVWWDPNEKIFKMWYEAGWLNTVCYATSKDGLAWERPSLGIKPGTNQVLPLDLKADSWNVIPDWNAKDPSQRYKMYLRGPGGFMSGVTLISSDGIHWSNRQKTGESGDRSSVFYNPFRKKWIYSLRSVLGGHTRTRHYWECDDFQAEANWKKDYLYGETHGPLDPVAWCRADGKDPKDPQTKCVPQLYNLDAVAYESIMLGVFEIHRGPINEECQKTGLPKITELNFAYSRDGFHWSRPDRRAHIPAERHDVWDRGYVQPVGGICCIRGDTLWIYYTGFQGNPDKKKLDNMGWNNNRMYDRGATGLAFLRRDGFASMEAGAKQGTLTTRPVTFSGSQLFVNAATQNGELRVEILDEAGKPIEPYNLANCQPIVSDSTLQRVMWSDAKDLAELRGKPVRFRFTMQNGALYSFWVSRDTTGRSDGYVAAGGPGFTSLIDTVGRAALEAEQKLQASTESL